ncbi:MAG: hypothetical protein H8D45_31020 [Bacteroidetes bacterium]|nr:hypothetical protein [Bacteroidota bacterium]
MKKRESKKEFFKEVNCKNCDNYGCDHKGDNRQVDCDKFVEKNEEHDSEDIS